jgi:dihydrofolate reductase
MSVEDLDSADTRTTAKIVAGATISLDGFMSDSKGSAKPLYTDLDDWRQSARGQASIAATGAVLMGRKTFEMAPDPDSYAGNYEYQVPIFVLTRTPPARHPKEGSGLSFTFVTDGLSSALLQARQAAGDKQITAVGGAMLLQSLLNAGVVDELEIDIVPIFLHAGLRALDNLVPGLATFERIGVDALAAVGSALRFAPRHRP